MSFTPSSNIYIGSVPFDPSYRNYHYIPNRDTQYQHFLSLCPNSLRRGDYTYQRVNNSVVVPFNAETLYGYNYCMFQNENYGDRWFYSFITDVEYVNPNSSRLYLSLDLMQTWFPDCTMKSCLVEREHVNDDTIGAHLKDEGFDPGELKCTYYSFDNQNQYLYPVIASAVEPLKDGTYVNIAGNLYNGVYSGCALTVFLSQSDFAGFINALANNGQQDAISAIYMIPEFLATNKTAKSNGWGYWLDANISAPSEELSYNVGINDLDGYVPKNNKTLIYPNQYFEVTNFTGQTQRFRLEFFDTPGVAKFDKTGGCLQNSTLVYIPKGYNGISGRCVENAIYMADFPTCNWVYQTFLNMYGQSQVDLFGMKYNTMNEFALATSFVNATQKVTSEASRLNVNGMLEEFVNGALDMTSIYNDFSKATRTPNTSRGGLNSTTSLVNIGSYTVGFRKYTCRAEIAKQIDDFYSIYGYLVLENKVPNITGRPAWNYIKTNGASVVGPVPSTVLASINALFDRGITFWHTNDVGNYALDNSIV